MVNTVLTTKNSLSGAWMTHWQMSDGVQACIVQVHLRLTDTGFAQPGGGAKIKIAGQNIVGAKVVSGRFQLLTDNDKRYADVTGHVRLDNGLLMTLTPGRATLTHGWQNGTAVDPGNIFAGPCGANNGVVGMMTAVRRSPVNKAFKS